MFVYCVYGENCRSVMYDAYGPFIKGSQSVQYCRNNLEKKCRLRIKAES